MLKKLVREEWWTDTAVTTDSEGYATVEAFKGDYKISLGDKSCDVKLEDNEDLTITL